MICRKCPYLRRDQFADTVFICGFQPNDLGGEEQTIGYDKDLDSKPKWCKLEGVLVDKIGSYTWKRV